VERTGSQLVSPWLNERKELQCLVYFGTKVGGEKEWASSLLELERVLLLEEWALDRRCTVRNESGPDETGFLGM
jgi:hypothetical protein